MIEIEKKVHTCKYLIRTVKLCNRGMDKGNIVWLKLTLTHHGQALRLDQGLF